MNYLKINPIFVFSRRERDPRVRRELPEEERGDHLANYPVNHSVHHPW